MKRELRLESTPATYDFEAESRQEVLDLGHRVEVLSALRHPGLVEVVTGPAAGGHMSTRYVGPDLSDIAGTLEAEEVAGLGAAAATVVADLHSLGWVHGRLTPEHVLVGEGGRVVLCGVSEARPERLDGPRSVDVQDLVAILSELAATVPASKVGRRLLRVLRRRSWRDAAALASALASPRLSPRLPSGGMAMARRATPEGTGSVGGAQAVSVEPGPAGSEDRSTRDRQLAAVGTRRRTAARGLPLAGLAASAALAAVSLGWLAPPGTARRPLACPAVDRGCMPLRTVGGVLVAATGRYQVGGAGDVVVLGRWHCGSVALPALLRQSSGEVWVFDQWPTPGVDVAARLVATVPGATTLRVLAGGDGCDQLQASGPTAAPLDLLSGARR